MTLTDLYPKLKSFSSEHSAEGGKEVQYWPVRVDATCVPPEFAGVRTMFLSFHMARATQERISGKREPTLISPTLRGDREAERMPNAAESIELLLLQVGGKCVRREGEPGFASAARGSGDRDAKEGKPDRSRSGAHWVTGCSPYSSGLQSSAPIRRSRRATEQK